MFAWKQSGREERPGAKHRTCVGPSRARNCRERKQMMKHCRRHFLTHLRNNVFYFLDEQEQNIITNPGQQNQSTANQEWC